MEFRDLKAQYKTHKEMIDSAISEVLQKTDFIGGKQVQELEEGLAQYAGVKHCITCANGTDALQLALMAWGVGSGDAVFVPDFTFFSSGEVVSLVGATPIFVDVEPDTFNISAQSLVKAIQKVKEQGKLTPKVIVAVDLFGQPADYVHVRQIAEEYELKILEDGAQGFGGELDGRKACSFGDISTTSFFPSKPLGCYGDGGAIFTDQDDEAQLLRSLKVHGKGSDKYDNVRIGMNSRLDTLQAAVLNTKLGFLEQEIMLCNKAAERYTDRLRGIVRTPVILANARSSWAQYTIRLENTQQREMVMQQLHEAQIPSAIYYKKPMHEQKAFAGIETEGLSHDVTEQICRTCLSLPMHPYLQEDEIDRICECVIGAVKLGKEGK